MNSTLTKINQDEINAILWKACDTFRGTIDPSEYKNYILVMLFLKYISDVWKEHYEVERAPSGDDDALIRRRLRNERFVLPFLTLGFPFGYPTWQKMSRECGFEHTELLATYPSRLMGEIFAAASW